MTSSPTSHCTHSTSCGCGRSCVSLVIVAAFNKLRLVGGLIEYPLSVKRAYSLAVIETVTASEMP